MHKNIQRLLLTSIICLPLLANADAPEKLGVTSGISLGMNQYKEPGSMELEGPELGFHMRSVNLPQWMNFQFEGDLLLGQQKYSSQKTGSLDRVSNIETRWRALAPLFGSPTSTEGFSTGLAVHTLWNDLRGTTSTGNTGYERSSAQLWLPVRWASGNAWDIDTGWLLYGRHTSKLSQASASYTDLVNTQHRGEYAQISVKVTLDQHTLTPFVRYTHLADSDLVNMGGQRWLEPDSQRWQIGAIWELR
jgi:hypothetical protein